MSKLTPMMKQYLEIKKAHQDCILFFRLGDFYEMFLDDAKIASKILNIALTSRGKLEDQKIPMCGVPYHSAEGYIKKLVDAGKKIAICEQVEDPSASKGIVRREVIRVITPSLCPIGITPEAHTHQQNYLASIVIEKGDIARFGLAYLDLSTGSFRATVLQDQQSLFNELWRMSPKELLVHYDIKDHRSVKLLQKLFPNLLVNVLTSGDVKKHALEAHQRKLLTNLESIIQKTAQAIFVYLLKTHYRSSLHIQKIDHYQTHRTMQLDPVTIRNLELLETQYDKKHEGSLFWVLDQTKTAMGRRLLKQWILYPLLNADEIRLRQGTLRSLVDLPSMRSEIQSQLTQILDLERIMGRLTLGLAHARDLVALRTALKVIPNINFTLEQLEKKPLPTFLALTDLLDRAIVDQPPVTIKEGGIFREGYRKELDEWMKLCRDGKSFIANLERKERERSGIGSLKVRFNNVFGYYIEITKTHLKSVPQNYIRKQTLVNAERYITPELKEFEQKILSAEDKRKKLEYELFEELRAHVVDSMTDILTLAHECAELDVTCSFAQVASESQFVCPTITTDRVLEIREGRHPVIEKISEDPFIPNDTFLDSDKNLMWIITGPNMSGKSTVMRQVALITLLAQIGSFVPAESANIALVDRIFTRVGAQDNLSQGDSTFMVEMRETAHILRHATDKSLILLDEIGRGTSTFDGLSIAWAVADYIERQIGAKTLFATHYHELTELAKQRPRVQNMHVAVREIKGEIVFIRKLMKGGVQRSYGIEVARLAGLPESVVTHAKTLLKRLESKRETAAVSSKGAAPRGEIEPQIGLFS